MSKVQNNYLIILNSYLFFLKVNVCATPTCTDGVDLNQNETDIDTTRKTKIHAFIASLRNTFGGSKEDEQWMK